MDRRAMLGTLAAAPIAAASFISPAQAAQPPAFDPANPQHVATAFRKLAWSQNDQVTFRWIQMTRYGMVDSKLTPMWDMIGGTLFKVTDGGDGEYDVRIFDVDFFTDVETGALLESYKNPWTGKTLAVPYTTPKANVRRHGLNGLKLAMKVPGMKVDTAVATRPAWTQGQDIWVRSDMAIRMEPDGAMAGMAPPPNKSANARSEGMGGSKSLIQVNDWFTYHGRVADVMDPRVKNAPCDMSFNDLNTWSAWLEMDGMPGNFIGRGFGRKVFRYEDIPETWRKLLAARYPAIAKDPVQALMGG